MCKCTRGKTSEFGGGRKTERVNLPYVDVVNQERQELHFAHVERGRFLRAQSGSDRRRHPQITFTLAVAVAVTVTVTIELAFAGLARFARFEALGWRERGGKALGPPRGEQHWVPLV